MEMLRSLGMDPSAETSWAPEIPTLTPALMTLSLLQTHTLKTSYTHTHPHSHIHTHTHPHPHTHTFIHTFTLTFIHTHTHVHTHTLSLIHTHTHFHTLMESPPSQEQAWTDPARVSLKPTSECPG